MAILLTLIYTAQKRKSQSSTNHFIILFLIQLLLTPKVICLCNQYRARPARTSGQSDQALYCWLANFKNSHLDITENVNGQIKKEGGLLHLRNTSGLMVISVHI